MPDPYMTVSEWCGLRRISRTQFYRLRSCGRAPDLLYIGSKPVITPAADREWEKRLAHESARKQAAEKATALRYAQGIENAGGDAA